MKNYVFKKVDSDPQLHSEIWNDIPKAELDNTNFCAKDATPPRVTAQGVCSVTGITVRFESDETDPVTKYTHANQPAWLDSCVEFFFAPYPDEMGTYLNFEQSLGGALLIQKGPDAQNRAYIPHSDDDFRTQKEIRDDGWAVQFFIPFSFVDKHFETMQRSFRGNFQFCCENKGVYLTWNRIENPTPAFHKPEFFADMKLDLSLAETLHAECIKYGYHVFRICDMTEDGTEIITVNPSADTTHIYSITKCVMSILIGMLQDRKLLSVQDKIADYLSEYFPQDVDPKWYDVRICDVLRHRTGGSGGALFNEHTSLMLEDDKDLLYYIFCDKLPYEIGKEIVYCSSNYYIISRIIEKVTGQVADDWARKNLFTPLHIECASWRRCHQGHTFGATDLHMTVQDIAKLGWLYANHGVYEGRQYISEDWIRQATETIKVDNFGGYGFAVQKTQFMRDDEFYLAGAGDQSVVFTLGKPHVVSFTAAGAGGYAGLLKRAVELMREE